MNSIPGRIGQANEPTSPSRPLGQESANAAAAALRGLRITIDDPASSQGGGGTGCSSRSLDAEPRTYGVVHAMDGVVV